MFNEKKLIELERRIWELENPPKYKMLDKIDKTCKNVFSGATYHYKGVIIGIMVDGWSHGFSRTYKIWDGQKEIHIALDEL